jgi:hypothetical protein
VAMESMAQSVTEKGCGDFLFGGIPDLKDEF